MYPERAKDIADPEIVGVVSCCFTDANDAPFNNREIGGRVAKNQFIA